MKTTPPSHLGLEHFLKLFLLALAIAASLAHAAAATFYQGVTPATLPWPGGIVPYEFDPAVTPQQKEVYLDGMREWELAANIKFVPHTTEPNFVVLRFFFQKGTNTYVPGSPSTLTIDSLTRSQICHETGHLLGFQHEHVRTDRDNYISINFANLQSGDGEGPGSGGIADLYLIDSNTTTFGPYDFESVMHYSKRLFAQDPNVDVIDPQPPYVPRYFNRIGNLCISPLDRAGAAFLYGPPTVPLTNVVTNTADVGLGSLRAAIYYANDHPGSTITFSIPNTDPGFSNGVYTIYLTGELPPLVTNGTVIDATTQPGFAGKPVVAIDGSRLIPETFDTSGIHFYESGCTIRGLAINNTPDSAVQMLYNFCASNHVEGCYLGLAPDGTNAAPNGFQGVNLAGGAHDNIIGGTNAGQRNVLSAHLSSYGVTITETNTDNNIIEGNYIGLDATGTNAVPNFKSGVGIFGGPRGTIIGGTNAGAGNVISGNGEYGIFIGDPITLGTVIQGNYIGTDATGNLAISNNLSGIAVFNDAQQVTIGGLTTSARNVISGNNTAGIFLLGTGVSSNVIQGNFIGLNAAGTAAVPNTLAGIYALDAHDNLIGGAQSGARNVISGNDTVGIYLLGASNNVIQGNVVGLNSAGTAAVPNGFAGFYLLGGAPNNLIGGTQPGAGNTVSGNFSEGFFISDPGTVNNVIVGNRIGTDVFGTSSIPNGFTGVGIWDGAQNNFIGGTNAGEGNLISGNGGNGVTIGDTNTSGNVVQGNLIGTLRNGLTALPNGNNGVYIRDGASGNLIGGGTTAARNIISGNGNDGVHLESGANGNQILGNYLGVNATGTTPLGNQFSGVGIINAASSNIIGTADAPNIIGGNSAEGVYISDPGTSFNVVQGNNLGVAADGSTPVGNHFEGVVILNSAQGNIIGLSVNGAGAGNLIANSGLEGVAIYNVDSTSNTIRGNSIFNNGHLGINLAGGAQDGFGVTANDSQDADTGPNNLQNFPVITTASITAGSTAVSGTLNSTPNRSFIIDVYRNSVADPSGHGQGKLYLGFVPLTTDANGDGTFSFNASGGLAGDIIAATATDATTGDTGEFSTTATTTNGPAVVITFTGPFSRSNGGFGFNLTLQPNVAYRIQATTNLAETNAWVPVTNFTPITSPVSITDPAATNFPRRFYRVISP